MDDTKPSAEATALQSENERLRKEVEILGARVAELDRVAHMDPLVPVANRRGLVRQLEIAIARRARHKIDSALLFVDVDGLKSLNDTYGHSVGDAALLTLADVMVRSVRKTDLVARLGGDEFAILIDHADEKSAAEAARRVAMAVDDCEFLHDGRMLPLGIAVGFTLIVPDDDPEAVLDRADKEMYRDKAAA